MNPHAQNTGRLVTVVVLNWNGRRLLPDCLDALAKQDLDPDLWQTWVVDNGSTDDSLDLLAREYPDVHVVRNATNLGYAGGNNTALRTVTTPFVALLNNDARPEPEWLRHLLNAAQAPDADRVAAVCSKVLFEPRFLTLGFETPEQVTSTDPGNLGVHISAVLLGSDDITEESLWDQGAYEPEQHRHTRYRWTRPAGTLLQPARALTSTTRDIQLVIRARAKRAQPFTVTWPNGTTTVQLTDTDTDYQLTIPAGTPLVDVINNAGNIFHLPGYGADRGYQQVDQGQYDTAEDISWLCGAAVILRTQALQQVGVFDDAYFMYYEDTDLSWRLRAADWVIRYDPAAVVRHLHSASSIEWSPLFVFHVERNRLLTLVKNAPARLAASQALRFNLTTASMLRWALLQALRERRRPALRPILLRLRVTISYLRLLPRMLAARRQIGRTNVDRQQLLDEALHPPPHPT